MYWRAPIGVMPNRPRLVMWIVAAIVSASVSMRAQWLHEPTAGAPRTRDGKVDMTGRVPRLNGKPDLSGLWQVQGDPRAPGGLFGLGESLNSRRSWLDARGTPHSEEMRVEERFLRRDYGHMDLRITITDRKTFTRPVAFSVVLDLMPDTDLLEHYCAENERDDAHIRGANR